MNLYLEILKIMNLYLEIMTSYLKIMTWYLEILEIMNLYLEIMRVSENNDFISLL